MGKKMKLPNGYGSVFKASGNRNKPFAVVITTGVNKYGKQKRKLLGYVIDRTEGFNLLSEYHKNPYDLNLKNLTFSKVWDKVYKTLETLVSQGKMSESNLKCLESAYSVHCKSLYNYKLLDLKKRVMQDVIDKSGLKRTGKGHIKTVCVKIFEYAIDEYELPLQINPAIKLKAGDRDESIKKIPFSDEELDTLWINQNDNIIKICLIFCYSGVRPNELFNISKTNIFLDKDYMIGGSKTEAGRNRIIPIHPRIKGLIEYFMKSNEEFCFKSIIKKFNYGKFTREFKNTMEMLKFIHTPYECRHTFITRMKQAGANDYILKLIVGHSIQDLTEKVYTHRNIDELVNEVRRIK